MDAMDIESKLSDVTVTAIPLGGGGAANLSKRESSASSSVSPLSHQSPLIHLLITVPFHSFQHRQMQQQQQEHQLQQQLLLQQQQHALQMQLNALNAAAASSGSSASYGGASNGNGSGYPSLPTAPGMSKYSHLLAVIEEMGREIRPSYSGSRTSAERLKRGIVHARILVRECLLETERSARN